jgi:hypothetical protein
MSLDLALGKTSRSWARGPEPPAGPPATLPLVLVAVATLMLPVLARASEVGRYRVAYRSDFGGRRLRDTLEVPVVPAPPRERVPSSSPDEVADDGSAVPEVISLDYYRSDHSGRRLRDTLELPSLSSSDLWYGTDD